MTPETRARLDTVHARVFAEERLDTEQALDLLENETITNLGVLADWVRRKKHPTDEITYIIDRNINYTNVCNAFCGFCAFYRAPNHEEGYVLPFEKVAEKIDETYALGGNQILLQGGHNPDLKIEWYEEFFTRLKDRFPDLWLHALSPPEIVHIYKGSRISLQETIKRLIAAGLNSVPGGGAEILVDSVRRTLARNKCSTDEWLGVMREAHMQGLRTTATMMFGHVETRADRVEHLQRIRDLQDETGGFTAFISWTYQAENTKLGGREVTTAEYLRTLAVSRLFLDNIENFQASWVTQGSKMAGASLAFGVNDMGSTMIEENVVSAAGTAHVMHEPQIVAAILDAGFQPKRRDMTYSQRLAPVHS